MDLTLPVRAATRVDTGLNTRWFQLVEADGHFSSEEPGIILGRAAGLRLSRHESEEH